jgi:hypothetical protein
MVFHPVVTPAEVLALVPVQEHRLGVCQMEVRFPSPTYVRFAAVLRQEKNQSLDLTCFSE